MAPRSSTVAVICAAVLCLSATRAFLPLGAGAPAVAPPGVASWHAARHVNTPSVDDSMSSAASDWSLVAVAAVAGMLVGFYSGMATAEARPWPTEPDGMMLYSAHLSADARQHPQITDAQRIDMNDAIIDKIRAEYQKDVALRVAAIETPEAKAERVNGVMTRLRSLATEFELPA